MSAAMSAFDRLLDRRLLPLLGPLLLFALWQLVISAQWVKPVLLPPPGTAEVTSLPNVVWEIAGALVMGAVIGAGVSLYLRFIQKQLLIFGIIVAILGTEVARLAHVVDEGRTVAGIRCLRTGGQHLRCGHTLLF